MEYFNFLHINRSKHRCSCLMCTLHIIWGMKLPSWALEHSRKVKRVGLSWTGVENFSDEIVIRSNGVSNKWLVGCPIKTLRAIRGGPLWRTSPSIAVCEWRGNARGQISAAKFSLCSLAHDAMGIHTCTRHSRYTGAHLARISTAGLDADNNVI